LGTNIFSNILSLYSSLSVTKLHIHTNRQAITVLHI
jgi:hypothetical protein